MLEGVRRCLKFVPIEYQTFRGTQAVEIRYFGFSLEFQAKMENLVSPRREWLWAAAMRSGSSPGTSPIGADRTVSCLLCTGAGASGNLFFHVNNTVPLLHRIRGLPVGAMPSKG